MLPTHPALVAFCATSKFSRSPYSSSKSALALCCLKALPVQVVLPNRHVILVTPEALIKCDRLGIIWIISIALPVHPFFLTLKATEAVMLHAFLLLLLVSGFAAGRETTRTAITGIVQTATQTATAPAAPSHVSSRSATGGGAPSASTTPVPSTTSVEIFLPTALPTKDGIVPDYLHYPGPRERRADNIPRSSHSLVDAR